MDNQENLSLIEKTNLTLKTAGLNASIISVDQLRFAAPVIFVKVYEAFFGYQLEKINYSPANRYDHAMNVDIVLNALKIRYDSPLLHQTTGNLVVSGDIRSIEIVMSIFYGIAQKIVNEREESFKNTATVMEEPTPKQPKSKRAYYRSHTDEQVTGEFKVIMDRVQTLENKVHSNIFYTENEEKEVRSDNGAHHQPKLRKNRPTSAPPGGRKKVEKVNSETHFILNAQDDQNFDEFVVNKETRKGKKKRKPKSPDGRRSPPLQNRTIDNEKMKGKSHSMPYPRPSSAGHRRPKSDTIPPENHPEFIKRSTSQQANSSLVHDLYTYDWRTGRKISKIEAEQLLEQKKQRFLSLGVIVTDEGELRGADSKPLKIHDIRVAQDKQKQVNQKIEQQPKPLTATISEYPGRRTEQSVEDYQKKMTKLRNPEQDQPVQPSKPRTFSLYSQLEKLDVVISVEHCHDCENHPMTLRHKTAEYISHADDILKYCAQIVHSMQPCIRLGVIRFPAKFKSQKDSKKEIVENFERVGAFEVQVGYKDEKGNIRVELIYSKLNTRRWPSKTVVEKRLKSCLSNFGFQNYANSIEERYSGRSDPLPEYDSVYPVGAGPWSEVALSDPLWTYFPPSKTLKPQKCIFWCFDSRSYSFYPKFKLGDKIRIQHCPNPFGGVEAYTTFAFVRNSFKDWSTLDNMVTAAVEFTSFEVTVREDCCLSMNETDDTSPPVSINPDDDAFPLVLSLILEYGMDNNLLQWKQQRPSDYTKNGTIRLCMASFFEQLQELVWQGIHASPGNIPGRMIFPNRNEEIDVQLAYSSPILEHIFKLYDGKTVDTGHLMKSIRPSLTESQIRKYYFAPPRLDQPSSTQPEHSSPQPQPQSQPQPQPQPQPQSQPQPQPQPKSEPQPPSKEIQPTKTIESPPISSPPNIILSPSPRHDTVTEKVVDPPIDPPLVKDEFVFTTDRRISISFILIELHFSNHNNEKLRTLSIEMECNGNCQTCPVLGVEGESGKRHVSDLDWNPIVFEKSSSITNKTISIILKHRSTVLGIGNLPMDTVLNGSRDEVHKVAVTINSEDGTEFIIWFHLLQRELKELEDITINRLGSHNFPEEMDLYPDDYESEDKVIQQESPIVTSSHPPKIEKQLSILTGKAYIVSLNRIEARNLANVELMGFNDPYCVLQFGSVWSYKSSVLSNAGENAIWNINSDTINNSFITDGDTLSHLPLQIAVYDHNSLTSDTLIGSVSLNFKTILEASSPNYTCEIFQKNKVRGSLILSFTSTTNERVQSVLDNNEHISLTLDQLKWNTKEAFSQKLPVSLYGVFNLDYWERMTLDTVHHNGTTYEWNNLSITDIFPAKLLLSHSLKIEIYLKQQKQNNGTGSDHPSHPTDKSCGKAELNISQLLISDHLTNNFVMDSYHPDGNVVNGRIFVTINIHSPNVTTPRLETTNLEERNLKNSEIIPKDNLEKNLLLEIFHLTGGESHWFDTSLWSAETSMTDWLNIELENNSNHVIGIRLGSNGLTGIIPNQLFELKYLTELHLFDNKLEGEIPSSIGNLTNLRILYLNNNMLCGEIPNSIHQCINLEEIDFERNFLTGPIPEALALPKLLSLNLSQNKFDATSSLSLKFLKCKSLRSFICDFIPYQDPDSFYKVFDWIEAHQGDTLNTLLPTNQQQIEANLSEMTTCLTKFSQDILTTGSPFDTWMEDQTVNTWHGVVFNRIGELVSLILPESNLCGSLPECLENFHTLLYLDLSNNGLEGILPRQLYQIHSLQFLYLNNNSLEGEISEEILFLKNLKTFNVSNNQFSGALPNQLNNLIGLQRLQLAQNHFEGTLPSNFMNFPNLKELNLSDNSFHGVIPSLSGVPLLEILNLSKNQFSGSIPDSISQLVFLRTLDISFTEITGKLPEDMTQLNVLEEMDIQMTRLELDQKDPSHAKSILLKKLPSLSRVSL